MALAIAYGAASVAVALHVAPNQPTTYAAASTAAAVADLAAGLGLIGAGCLLWWERPDAVRGPVTVLLGVVWFAPDWVGWEAGPALVRSVAMVAVPFLLPLLFAFVRAPGRVPVLVAAAAFSVAFAAVHDPFLDVDCWSNCTDNVFLVHAAPAAARTIADVWLWVVIVAGVGLVAYAGRRLLAASRAARAAEWAILVPAALAAAAEAAYAIAQLGAPEDPERAGVFLVRAAAYCCVAAGVAWTVVRQWRTSAAIQRLADDLGEAPAPGALRAALARTLGDPALTVGYRLPASDAYVDAEGRPIVLDGRATTPIVRHGEPVALVVHDGTLAGVERKIGAAARLAVDNERLRAEALSQLEDLRASRARIVEAGDAARQRIERDLHDGAQQRLLTLSYELRLAHADAEAAGEAELAARLARGGEEVKAALAELRELAHGIYPAILTEAGLGPALYTLADGARLPVEVEAAEERLPAPVERAAYALVAGAVEFAHDHLAVSVEHDGRDVVVTIAPLAVAPPADRVGALGGRITVQDGTLRAEIPCA
jgi:signal transduction histidine kinase